MSLKITVFILLIICLMTLVSACELKTKAAEPAADDAFSQKVDDLFKQWNNPELPGCAVAVVKEGKFIYKRTFGAANLDYNIPITSSTLFNIGSMSKQFTAASIALLAEQGKLSLDDDINKYLPEMPHYAEPITIRHLIHHTSGLRDYLNLIALKGDDSDNIYTYRSILSILSKQKGLNFKPGEKFLYSNSGYTLMAIIIERVSGKTLRKFQEENIFKPLGMKNTQLYDNRHEPIKNRASGYLPNPDKSFSVRASMFDLGGDGGILSTIEDLQLWDQNFYEPKVGNKEFLSLITTPGKFNSGEKSEYAFGLFVSEYRGLPIIEHSGVISGFRSGMYRFPNQKFTVTMLCNNSGISPNPLIRKIADIYLAVDFKPSVSENKDSAISTGEFKLSEAELSQLAGLYANIETGQTINLHVKDGKIAYSANQKDEFVFMPIAEKRLRMADVPDKVEMKYFKTAVGLELEVKVNNGNTIRYKAVKKPFDSAQKLAEYVGTYYSEELETHYVISLRNDKISIKPEKGDEMSLIARYEDFFAMLVGSVNLSFFRSKKGKPEGFLLNSSRAKGIKFIKKSS